MSAPGDDLDEVVREALSGDNAALGVLYDSLQPSLVRYLSWQEPSAGEDLAAETWLVVAERLSSFEGDGRAFRAWLFGIARRRLSDHRRRLVRRRTFPVSGDLLDEHAGREDPESLAIETLSSEEAIAQLTSLLSPDQAEVMVLRVVGGLSVEETAGVVGKRPGSVRVLQHRALRRLARKLGEELPVEA